MGGSSNTVPIPVRAIDFVMYCAKDSIATRAWYQELFGLQEGDMWYGFWSEFATDPVALCINGPNTSGDTPDRSSDDKWDLSGSPAIAFAIEDMQSAVDECRRRGIKILKGPVESRVCWMLFIEDPEGNRIVLHQRKDGTAG